MPFICMKCGSTERFSKEFSGTATVSKKNVEVDYTGRIIMDGNGETIDYEDEEYGEESYGGQIEDIDNNEIEDYEYPECYECNGSDVEEMEEDEIELVKWKHTDKDGKWHEEELPEEERDEEVGQQLVLDRI